MLKSKCCLFTVFLLLLFSLTGCWDKVEIDQRGFVGLIAIDMAPPGYTEQADESVKGVPVGKQTGKFIKVTYAFPDPRLLGGEGGGGGDAPASLTFSSIALSIPKTNGYVDSRISRRLYFGHTKVIIFGEEFLNNPDKVKEVVDYIDRDANFSWTMRILVSEGEASKIADVKPKDEKLLFRYVRGIIENKVTSGRVLDVRFNRFISSLREDGSAILPKIHVRENEVKIAGISLIKDFKQIGYLSEYDTMYFNTLYGERSGGRIYLNLEDTAVSFTTSNSSRKVKLLNSDPKSLEVGIHVNIEGSITGDSFKDDAFDADTIKNVEKELNKSDEENCKFVIKKLQKDYNIDALRIGDYLRKYHPSVWDEVKDKWKDIYPTIKITPIIDYKVRRIGTIK